MRHITKKEILLALGSWDQQRAVCLWEACPRTNPCVSLNWFGLDQRRELCFRPVSFSIVNRLTAYSVRTQHSKNTDYHDIRTKSTVQQIGHNLVRPRSTLTMQDCRALRGTMASNVNSDDHFLVLHFSTRSKKLPSSRGNTGALELSGKREALST